nr:hypothetical protein [Chloroflexota bacterium]
LPAQPTGATYRRNLPAQPTGATYRRNLPAQPTGATYRRNLPAQPTGAVWGQTPPNRAEKSSPPPGAGLGVGETLFLLVLSEFAGCSYL